MKVFVFQMEDDMSESCTQFSFLILVQWSLFVSVSFTILSYIKFPQRLCFFLRRSTLLQNFSRLTFEIEIWPLLEFFLEFSGGWQYPRREQMQSLEGSYKILVENGYPCKILQGNINLASSCKEIFYLQVSWKILPRICIYCQKIVLRIIKFTCKIWPQN